VLYLCATVQYHITVVCTPLTIKFLCKNIFCYPRSHHQWHSTAFCCMFNVATADSDKSVMTIPNCEISLILLNTGNLFPFDTGLLVIFFFRKHFQIIILLCPPPNIIFTFALIAACFLHICHCSFMNTPLNVHCICQDCERVKLAKMFVLNYCT